MNNAFEMSEFDRAIKCCREKSSPGLDNIEYKMLKLLTNRFKTELLSRMNHAFINSIMFKDWKEVQTIFIEKKTKIRFVRLQCRRVWVKS